MNETKRAIFDHESGVSQEWPGALVVTEAEYQQFKRIPELERECAQLRAALEYVREFLYGDPIRHALNVDGITLDEYISNALARSGAK